MPKWTVLDFIEQNTEKYEEMLRNRGLDVSLLQDFLKADKKYKEKLKILNEKRAELNKISREIGKNPSEKRKENIRRLKDELKALEEEFKDIETKRKLSMLNLPNMLDENVPKGSKEEDNKPIEFFGKPKIFNWKLKGHAELLENVLKKADTLQAGKVSASRFYYIFDDICWLDFALSLYAIDFLSKKGYTLVIPPYMLRKEVLESALSFKSFEEMIYKIENEDLYLIGTAEHPLLALYKDRVLEEDQLPIRLVGWSPCFRKEAGAHGKDTKGIFRVHQFHKVEQFIFCHSDLEESRKLHKELIRNSVELWKGLEIPFRLVQLCSGETGHPAISTVDLEVWFPSQGRYREMGSASNCTDWQSFRGNLVFRDKKTGKMKYVYTLNNTAIPTSRAICAIVENNQTENNEILIPKVLRKYLEPFEKAPKEKIVPLGIK